MTHIMEHKEIVQIVQKYRFIHILKLLSLDKTPGIKSILIHVSNGLKIKYEHNENLIEFGYDKIFYISGKSRIQVQTVNNRVYMYNMEKKYILEAAQQAELVESYRKDTTASEWFAIEFFSTFNTPEKVQNLIRDLSVEP